MKSGVMWRVEPLQILLAVALDLLLGDPRGWPHIARATGDISAFYEKWLAGKFKRSIALGALFWALVAGTMLLGYTIACFLCGWLSPLLAYALNVLVIYQSVAAVDLARHVRRVLAPLLAGDLDHAREKLSLIVGRDTGALDESEISRAAIEATAESLTDAVVAPLFWAVVAGAPGALLYRVANTLDSMVGHRDERYERFGRASARIDDALNWLPARLAAGCIAARFGLFPAWKAICGEAKKHASPNAGWTEAAMAYALKVRLGGENVYHGVRIVGPVFNKESFSPAPLDVERGLGVMWRAFVMALAVLLLCSLTLNRLLQS